MLSINPMERPGDFRCGPNYRGAYFIDSDLTQSCENQPAADRMNIDIYKVIRAAATKPLGFVPYYPGPGLGGHCIPIDPFYVTWKARQYGVHTRFIELANEINSAMPHWVVGKVIDALNEKKQPVKGRESHSRTWHRV